MKIKKVLFFVVTVLLTSLLVTGCIKQEPSVTTSEELPKILAMGTMPVGTTVNMAGSGIANLISQYTPMQVKVVPAASENVWIPMLKSGEVDLGVANMAEAEGAYLGKGVWSETCKQAGVEGFPVRLVATGAKAYLSFNVRGNSPYQKVSDLKGARVARYAPGSGLQDYVLASLANGGLTPDDVKFIPVANPAEGGRALMDGRVDASYVAPDAPIIMEMVTKVGARYLPLDPSPEAQARVAEVNHQLRVETPDYTFPNVLEKPIPMLVFDWGLITIERVPESVIYEATKVMWEHQKELNQKPALERWDPQRFCSPRFFVPYHSGAIKFYKEQGLWTKEMDDRQKELLAQFKG